MSECRMCGADHAAKDRFDYTQIPPLVREALDAHVATGRPCGSFTEAVLEHDLFQACHRGDDASVWVLPVIVAYIHNQLPWSAHGSPEAVREWRQHRGMEGLSATDPVGNVIPPHEIPF